MATGAGLRGTTAAASENAGHGGDRGRGGAPNAASSVPSSVRPSCHACTAGLHNRITAAAHSATVIPVSQRWYRPQVCSPQVPPRRPSHSAAAAKQTGSGTSHSAISGTTIPTGHASPIATVQTGHGKTVRSAANANATASTSSDHRTVLTSRRFQGEGCIRITRIIRASVGRNPKVFTVLIVRALLERPRLDADIRQVPNRARHVTADPEVVEPAFVKL